MPSLPDDSSNRSGRFYRFLMAFGSTAALACSGLGAVFPSACSSGSAGRSATGGAAGDVVPQTGGANGSGGRSASGGASGNGSGGAATVGGSRGGSVGGATGSGGLAPVACDSGPAGGVSGTAGSSGGAGASGNPGADPAPLTGLGGSPTRPLLTADQARAFTVSNYLAQTGPITAPTTDGWDPTAGVDVANITPGAVVAASGGTHTSVQAAITAAATMCPGARRIYVRVTPGIYRELVCVPANAPPITLYSTNPDASQTTIVFSNAAGTTTAGASTNLPCLPVTAATLGTDASATFAVFAANFQAKNLTIANDADETPFAAAGGNGQTQAVALHSRGDRAAYENVRFLGNQDTLLVKSANASTITRAYFKSCYVEGDVDYIFGRGRIVIDGGEIKYRTSRRGPSNGGDIISPSTDARSPYGILITGAAFTADSDAAAGSVGLGRAWDESGGTLANYLTLVATTGIYPNGQAVIMGSTLGPHIAAVPWKAAATTSRPYSSTAGTYPANRLYEYNNTSPAQ